MDFFKPKTLEEALTIKSENPDATCLQGGTDLMVEINFDRKRPVALLDLSSIPQLRDWTLDGNSIRLGSGVTYTRIIQELAHELPGLALASRTVGSLQIRNRGGVGGNLGSASPAGDSHPALLATGATVNARSVRGSRGIDINDFYLGPKRNALAPDEIIESISIPCAKGGQQYSKIGTRNAMVIAVASFGIALDHENRRVGSGIGSAGPTPLRALGAETFAAAELDWIGYSVISDSLAEEFGRLVAAAAKPIDDIRGTAEYRRHTLSVIAKRCLTWSWNSGRNAERSTQ